MSVKRFIKTAVSVLSAVVVAAAVVGCGDDDDGGGGGNGGGNGGGGGGGLTGERVYWSKMVQSGTASGQDEIAFHFSEGAVYYGFGGNAVSTLNVGTYTTTHFTFCVAAHPSATYSYTVSGNTLTVELVEGDDTSYLLNTLVGTYTRKVSEYNILKGAGTCNN